VGSSGTATEPWFFCWSVLLQGPGFVCLSPCVCRISARLAGALILQPLVLFHCEVQGVCVILCRVCMPAPAPASLLHVCDVHVLAKRMHC
jgi:hypothetical protein